MSCYEMHTSSDEEVHLTRSYMLRNNISVLDLIMSV